MINFFLFSAADLQGVISADRKASQLCLPGRILSGCSLLHNLAALLIFKRYGNPALCRRTAPNCQWLICLKQHVIRKEIGHGKTPRGSVIPIFQGLCQRLAAALIKNHDAAAVPQLMYQIRHLHRNCLLCLRRKILRHSSTVFQNSILIINSGQNSGIDILSCVISIKQQGQILFPFFFGGSIFPFRILQPLHLCKIRTGRKLHPHIPKFSGAAEGKLLPIRSAGAISVRFYRCYRQKSLVIR